jgi:hypothetical protein
MVLMVLSPRFHPRRASLDERSDGAFQRRHAVLAIAAISHNPSAAVASASTILRRDVTARASVHSVFAALRRTLVRALPSRTHYALWTRRHCCHTHARRTTCRMPPPHDHLCQVPGYETIGERRHARGECFIVNQLSQYFV